MLNLSEIKLKVFVIQFSQLAIISFVCDTRYDNGENEYMKKCVA